MPTWLSSLIVIYNDNQLLLQLSHYMSCTRKNGIRYPLHLDTLEKSSNGTDTPRFPSREFQGINDAQHTQTIARNKHPSQQLLDSLSFSFQRNKSTESKKQQKETGKQKKNLHIFAENNDFSNFEETCSAQQSESKSATSLHSLRQKLASRSAKRKMRDIRQIVKNRQTKTVSNLLTFQSDSPPAKTNMSQSKDDTNLHVPTKIKEKASKLKLSNKILMYNSSTEKSIKNTVEKTHLQDINRTEIKKAGINYANLFEKGRSLKSILFKAKPMLQIKSRLMNNHKLQSFNHLANQFQ